MFRSSQKTKCPHAAPLPVALSGHCFVLYLLQFSAVCIVKQCKALMKQRTLIQKPEVRVPCETKKKLVVVVVSYVTCVTKHVTQTKTFCCQ